MITPDENNLMSEVFVSHTSADTAYCRFLVLPAIEAVVERRFNQYVFMNWNTFGRESGENAARFAAGYVKEIDRLLRDSRSFAVVISTAAIGSKWVSWEVNWWLTNRSIEKLIIILSEDCNPSDLDCRLVAARTVFLPNINDLKAQPTLQEALKGVLK